MKIDYQVKQDELLKEINFLNQYGVYEGKQPDSGSPCKKEMEREDS